MGVFHVELLVYFDYITIVVGMLVDVLCLGLVCYIHYIYWEHLLGD